VRRARIAAVLAGIVLLPAWPVSAQTAVLSSRLELGAGVLWMGQQALGDTTVTETTSTGGTRTLFTASSELAAAAGFAGRVGVRLTRSLVAEFEGAYLKPQLRIALANDVEDAASTTATETVEQFTVGGGALWYLPGVGTRRVAPFATVGGGYLRQLHEQETFVETGSFFQFGGGASILLVTGRHWHSTGIGARVDARAVIRAKGVSFDGGSTTSPAVGVSAFVRF
jgi:hypothetical protein